VGGSAWSENWSCAFGAQRAFVKVAPVDSETALEAEADGLRELAAANAVRVPGPLAVGSTGRHAYLALEWLDLAGDGRDAPLGRALARLHRNTTPRFGWHRDNTIGGTPQLNGWLDDWPKFVRDRRLGPQLALAAGNGHGGALARDGERVLDVVPALLAGHEPIASLLHGDLWSGNAGRLAFSGEPVIMDPAVYYGDREADLAMTELFGGFGPDFYAAYREAWPIDAGYPIRRTLYNLYHVLNHLNLFGEGYLAQARQMIGALLATVR
jgi:fructosamine-3-kinase